MSDDPRDETGPSKTVEEDASDWASLANLDFPLNVYALALGLGQGYVEALHYGLFETPSEAGAPSQAGAPSHAEVPEQVLHRDSGPDLALAQARATDRLLAQLPPAPARVLEVGIGLGKTLRRLSLEGYRVEGITPDSHQVAMARHTLPHVPVEEGRFECASRPPGSLDVVLFQESAQYIDREVVLARSFEWLCVGGLLIIMDEVPSAEVPEWRASSERLGYRERAFVDYTAEAAPSVDVLVRSIETHRAEIESRLGLSPVRLYELVAELKRRRAAYRLGRHRYVLFHWEKKGPK
ncbi:MAG: methyltransferase domain-containing protein [Deltaproteobacteria bacterium]|nr:methyltransferase domain-containing protein [Deltaproteobacteria bacterium]